MKKFTTGLMAAAVIAGPAAFSAQAVSIDNTTQSAIQFLSDGFESQLGNLGGRPSSSGSTAIGWWGIPDTDPQVVVVQNESTAGFGAYEGDLFVSMNWAGSGPRGELTPAFSAGDVDDVIEFSFAFRVDEGFLRFEVLDGSNDPWPGVLDLRFFDDGAIVNVDRVAWSSQTLSTTHTPEAWNSLVFRYTVGSDTAEMSINDSAFEDIDLMRALPGDLTNYADFSIISAGNDSDFYSSVSSSLVYVDSIPEPASLALIGLGGAMMLGRRRK